MLYSDNSRTIKEQLKAVKLNIPKMLIILLTDIILITVGTFLGIIGAKFLGITLIIITMLTSLLLPIGKLKSEQIVWTVINGQKNK